MPWMFLLDSVCFIILHICATLCLCFVNANSHQMKWWTFVPCTICVGMCLKWRIPCESSADTRNQMTNRQVFDDAMRWNKRVFSSYFAVQWHFFQTLICVGVCTNAATGVCVCLHNFIISILNNIAYRARAHLPQTNLQINKFLQCKFFGWNICWFKKFTEVFYMSIRNEIRCAPPHCSIGFLVVVRVFETVDVGNAARCCRHHHHHCRRFPLPFALVHVWSLPGGKKKDWQWFHRHICGNYICHWIDFSPLSFRLHVTKSRVCMGEKQFLRIVAQIYDMAQI